MFKIQSQRPLKKDGGAEKKGNASSFSHSERSEESLNSRIFSVGDSSSLNAPQNDSFFGVLTFILFSFFVFSSSVQAAAVIRDSEIETYLQDLSAPLFAYADIHPKIYVILDPTANAFATEGQLIFVHSGLIFLLENQNQLRAVLAHETGHLLGGHLARLRQEIERAQMTALLSAVIGTLAAVISGDPGAAAAGVLGGQMSALGQLMHYQQSEESSADQIAIAALHSFGASAGDLRDVMTLFEKQDRYQPQGVLSYMRTHPLSTERKNVISQQISLEKRTKPAAAASSEFLRIQAKLYAFTMPPEQTFARYPTSDYAHAIAYYKMGNTRKSFQILDKLTQQNPKDVFLAELYGQFLFESGKAAQAFPYYLNAMQTRPFDFLIAYGGITAAVESDNKDFLRQAEIYIPTLLSEPSAQTYKLYARFYERLGKKAFMAYGMAEYMAALGETDQAQSWIAKAKNEKDGTEALSLRISDFENALKKKKKK